MAKTKQLKFKSIKDVVLSDNYSFTTGQLRFLLAHRRENGLAKVVRKIGKCIYFRMDLFDAWIDKQGE